MDGVQGVWQQPAAPIGGDVAVSALVAAVPVLVLGLGLIGLRMRPWRAVALALAVCLAIAVAVYGMPLPQAGSALLFGALIGLVPIGAIVFTAVLLFNLVVDSGRFALVRSSLIAVSPDPADQVLLVAVAFGALLEGAAGFGTPVAIAGAMLAGLGFSPLRAALAALVANTAPVAFGGLGLPVIVAVKLPGVAADLVDTTRSVALLLPAVALASPELAVAAGCGWSAVGRAWPRILLATVVFTVLHFATAYWLGPALPNIVAGLGTMVAVLAARSLASRDEPPGEVLAPDAPPRRGGDSTGSRLRAWAPFLMLMIIVVVWGIPPVKHVLGLVTWRWELPSLDCLVARPGEEPLAAVYELKPLATPGAAILLAAVLSIPLVGLRPVAALRSGLGTLTSLAAPLATIVMMLAFAYLMNFGGPAGTLGAILAATGPAYPWLAPMLGWLGVFLTGSDTSSNAVFGGMQAGASTHLGLPAEFGLAANTVGGGVGKVVSPQSIAVATGAVGAAGRDGEFLRAAVPWGLILLALVCLGSGVLAWAGSRLGVLPGHRVAPETARP